MILEASVKKNWIRKSNFLKPAFYQHHFDRFRLPTASVHPKGNDITFMSNVI